MHRITRRIVLAVVAILPLLTLTSCGRGADRDRAPAVPSGAKAEGLPELSPVALSNGERLRVVATTSVVADVVAQVGGDHIELTTLMPLGTDPHGYTATPQDLRAISDAHVLFINGLGLEESLLRVLDNRDGDSALISVSAGIEPLAHPAEDEAEHEGEHGGADPHTWFSVRNVETWTENVAQSLAALDRANAEAYRANAAAYHETLEALDVEIRAAVETVPTEQRKLVTDHDEFGYFAADYGFTIVGSVIPSLSTQASPSAQELAQLQEQIRQEGVKAIFTGNSVNPQIEEQLAADTGTRVVHLYPESLSEPGGPASTYVDLMRYNVTAIVDALR